MAQKWHQKASVQVAIVTTIGAVIITFITIGLPLLLETPQIKEENVRLKQENQQKNIEIQRLDTLLTPFKTIALERYTGTEPEVLKKLAEQIIKLQEEDIKNIQKIQELEKELIQAKELAEQPQLLLRSYDIEKNEDGYKTTLHLKPSKNEPLGFIAFIATIEKGSNATILKFYPTKGQNFVYKDTSQKILDSGKRAELFFQPLVVGYISLDLEVSEKTNIFIEGSHKLKTFEIKVR